MTLLVIDNGELYADTYASVTAEDGNQRYMEEFPKIFRIDCPVVYERHTSYHHIAFTGDAHTFYWFLTMLMHVSRIEGTVSVPMENLVTILERAVTPPLRIILPTPTGALTIYANKNHPPKVEYLHGTVLGFGAAYNEPGHQVTEGRTWHEIFVQSYELGDLPGGDIHYVDLTDPTATPSKGVLMLEPTASPSPSLVERLKNRIPTLLRTI